MWPFWTAALVGIYRELSEERAAEAAEPEQPGARSCLVGCILAVVLLVVGAALIMAWTAGWQHLIELWETSP